MKSFKLISFMCVLTILMQLFFISSVFAEEDIYENLPVKTVEVNVAQYKPVSIGSGTENATYPLSNITDGNRETFADFTYSNKITIDLMRRYSIKRIELYARTSYANEAWCSNFKVYGSNDEDFSESTELHSYGAYNADLFPVKGSYSFSLSGDKPYRYIRVEYPSGTTWLGYGDIRVFADVDVTQVSKAGMSVITAPESAYYPGSNLIDGNNGTFVYPNYTGYAFFSIDLENEYPIGMIEIDSRADGGDGYSVHYGISTYGSNSLIDNETNVSKSALTEDEGYTKLTWIQPTGKFSAYDDTNPDRQFKRYSVETREYPCYREVCNDSEKYRYITVKDDEQTCFQASELRAYVINPKVCEAERDGANIMISFSDVMSLDSLEDNLIIKSGSEVLEGVIVSQTDDGYGVDVTGEFLPNTEYTLIIDKNALNEAGVPMAYDYAYSFKTPTVIEVVEDSFKVTDGVEENSPSVSELSQIKSGNVGVKLTIRNNSVVEDEAIVLALLYNKEGILSDADESRVKLSSNADTEIAIKNMLSVGEDLSGYKLYVYVWKDFNLMEPWSMCKIID